MRGNPVLWEHVFSGAYASDRGYGRQTLMKQYEEKIRIVECAPEELKTLTGEKT